MDRAKVIPLLKGVLVLAVIALCSGLLLGAFNILTYVDPLQATYEQFAADTGATFSEMKDEEGQTFGSGSVVYYAVSDDGQYHAFLASGSGGFNGTIQLYVYLKDDQIAKVVLGDNAETLWNQFEDDFFEQFVGLKPSDFSSFGSADIETGATAKLTIQAVANAINAVVQYYNTNVAAGGENNG